MIRQNREARGWTEYQLAERSGLPQSTISSWYKKGMTPSF
ncbi:MAG TPA: transcriptional regulator, partial [Ruminococcaceae bacterium]|nr:transcriptional regulator [Oscillospiraceae bacterium]